MFIIFILLLIPAVITWKKGNKSSLYFILGNLMLLFSLIGFFTVNVVLENGSYAKWVLQIGATLEIIMFSIGIGNKVTGLVKEKAEAQEEIIKQLKENEKIKDEANAQLENKVIERTAEVVKQKHLIEEKQKEILDSIHYAKRLQEAILPPLSFINEHLPNNFVLYQPKDVVAGDFYWAEMKDDKFFIAAADCTGHGVPGAMVSVVCSNALNRTVNEFGITNTGNILDKTRELVLETFAKGNSEVKDGMDISLLCIDKKNNKAFWSGANNPLWYIDSVTSSTQPSVTSSEVEKSTATGLDSAQPEIKEIKADKQPIGKTENPKPFTTHEIELKPGIQFYLFTDGYADQFGGPKGKKFKYKQLEEFLLENANKTMQEQHQTLLSKFSEWKGDLEQVDDVCVIGLLI
jgi:serine phosphatase RsbU (regulator of sigma subunit)